MVYIVLSSVRVCDGVLVAPGEMSLPKCGFVYMCLCVLEKERLALADVSTPMYICVCLVHSKMCMVFGYVYI